MVRKALIGSKRLKTVKKLQEKLQEKLRIAEKCSK